MLTMTVLKGDLYDFCNVLSSYNKGRCSVTQPIMWLGAVFEPIGQSQFPTLPSLLAKPVGGSQISV